MSGRKDDKNKAPITLIPRSAIEAEARVMAIGATKYGRDNWRQGMNWSRLLDAAMRHILAYADGETFDVGEGGSGESHLANARCCLAFLIEYEQQGLGTDDRSISIPEQTKQLRLPDYAADEPYIATVLSVEQLVDGSWFAILAEGQRVEVPVIVYAGRRIWIYDGKYVGIYDTVPRKESDDRPQHADEIPTDTAPDYEPEVVLDYIKSLSAIDTEFNGSQTYWTAGGRHVTGPLNHTLSLGQAVWLKFDHATFRWQLSDRQAPETDRFVI